MHWACSISFLYGWIVVQSLNESEITFLCCFISFCFREIYQPTLMGNSAGSPYFNLQRGI